jgi:hypothetical protein
MEVLCSKQLVIIGLFESKRHQAYNFLCLPYMEGFLVDTHYFCGAGEGWRRSVGPSV